MPLKGIELNVLAPAEASVFLLLRDNQLVTLGEGRFARVYLGSRRAPLDQRPFGLGELIAIKFLKKDLISEAVTKNSTYRFCREVLESMRARDRGLGAAVVCPVGYGRTAVLPPDADPLLKVYEEGFVFTLRNSNVPNPPRSPIAPRGQTVFGSLPRARMDAIFAANAKSLADGGLAVADWSGDFYALDLCLISLEELLLTTGNPIQQSSGKAMESVDVKDAPIMLQLHHDLPLAGNLDLQLLKTDTGFADLHAIVKSLIARGYEPDPAKSFRRSALFALWIRCAEKVRDIHSVTPTNQHTGLAHRDLKPANILVDTTPQLQVRLADLGFLSSVAEILTGNFSLASSVDEGGALPRGSRGFRAPEQMQIGDDLSFEQLKVGAGQIELLKYLDQTISDGDWLRIQGEFNNGTAMTRLRRGSDRVHALESPFAKPADLSKGQLIPDVSLHSDVFAMGCLAYFLASDGRNPERFWRQYLDELALQALAASLPTWVTNSPLWLACALCIDHPVQVKKDLKALWRAMSSDRRRTLDGSEQSEEHYTTVLGSLSSLPA